MPKMEFDVVVDNELKRLIISWKNRLKDIQISLGNNYLLSIKDKKEIGEGKAIQLSKNSSVLLRLKKKFIFSELSLIQNNSKIPEVISPNLQLIYSASNALILFSYLSIVFGTLLIIGLIASSQQVSFQQIFVGLGLLIIGFIFYMLSKFIRMQSLIALVIASIILTFSMIYDLIITLQLEYYLNAGALVIKIIFLIPLIMAFKGIYGIRKQN